MKRLGWFLFGTAIVAIAICLCIWAALACRNPAWRTVLNGAPSCAEFWLNRYQGLIGALATLFAGFLAYRAVLNEAKRAEKQARNARKAVLNDEIQQLCRDIDTLRLAADYIGKYVDRFPSEDKLGKAPYLEAFRQAHIKGQDFVSMTALDAPGGYGSRIHTLMAAIKDLGARVEEQIASMGSNPYAATNLFGDDIIERVTGLRTIQNQMRATIPSYEGRLNGLRRELAAL
jgi:hypothetical protein